MKSNETLPTIPRIGGLHGNHLEITTLSYTAVTQGYIRTYVCLTQLKVTVIRTYGKGTSEIYFQDFITGTVQTVVLRF